MQTSYKPMQTSYLTITLSLPHPLASFTVDSFRCRESICLDCRKIISGYDVRSYVIEYAYCERCFKTRSRKLETQLQSHRLAEQKAKEEKIQHQVVARQAEFLSSWDSVLPLTDVALKAEDGPDVRAHKAVLAGKSPVFKAMFDTPMKESQTGVVIIKDIPHEVLQAFIRFFYTATVSPNLMEKHAPILFCTAEKYGVYLLKLLCEEHIVRSVTRENAIGNLELARKYGSEKVKAAVLDALLLDMDKIHTYADYKTYAQKDPTLLVELYEGMLGKINHKRKRSDDNETESTMPSKSTAFSFEDAESITG